MGKAGEYPDRVQWLHRTTAKSSIGQDVETWTPSGYLWCRVEQTSGRDGTDYGAEQTGADGEVRVRNYPSLSPLDRLYYGEFAETYIIDSLHRGNNEIVCQVHTFTSGVG